VNKSRRFLIVVLGICLSLTELHGQQLSEQQAAMIRFIDEETPDATRLLARMVNINSGTFNKTGVVEVGKLLEPQFQNLGFNTRWVQMDGVNRAPSLVAERKGDRGKRVVLIGHMDTVFEPSSPFQEFVRNGETAVGPGAGDMKGGIVIILSALKALRSVGALDRASITVFLTDPGWGKIRTLDCEIEIGMGNDEDVQSIVFHVYGGELAPGVVVAILRALQLRALDSATGEIFNEAEAADSFMKWQKYRDKIRLNT
jgi:Peptidase family M20/M25/M40